MPAPGRAKEDVVDTAEFAGRIEHVECRMDLIENRFDAMHADMIVQFAQSRRGTKEDISATRAI